jgi:hypothetical protein
MQISSDTKKILDFIPLIGLEYEFMTLDGDTFVPGIRVQSGQILIDREKLKYPGDLLHEAGHLAVLKQEKRKIWSGELTGNSEEDGNEIAAIAWSWAAAVHLNISPEILFHPDGYKGDSDWLIEQFRDHTPIGIPLLQWMGFCYDEKKAKEHNQKPYPFMLRWLRE